MNVVTADVLRAIVPRVFGAAAQRQSQIIEAIASEFTPIVNEYEINTDLRLAHFLAQIVHESAGLQTTEEFASGAAYEGRVDLGNTVRGDGKRYKGRGVLQLTGRANYRRYGKILGLDLEGQPHIAAEPLVSLRIACVYWRDRNINPLCDADDLVAVTRKVNGGTNGLADRGRYLAKAKAVLARPAPPTPVVATAEAAPASSAGLLSNITSTTSSASAINALAAEGSRLAATIQGVFRWFWTILFGGTAVASTVKTTVNPDAGTAAVVNAWISAHPFLFAGCAIGALLTLQYAGMWVLRKYFITAVKDNRYEPRGIPK
jgi:putative chitinase